MNADLLKLMEHECWVTIWNNLSWVSKNDRLFL